MLRRLMAHLSDAEQARAKDAMDSDSTGASPSGSSSDEEEDDEDEDEGEEEEEGEGEEVMEEQDQRVESAEDLTAVPEDTLNDSTMPGQEKAMDVACEESDEEWGLPLTEQQRLRHQLASIELLVEPILLPDLHHSGVPWQFPAHPDPRGPAIVSVPNHTVDETDVKLFYPTGAKNTNMREYIKDVIQKHRQSPIKSRLHASESAPELSQSLGDGAHAANGNAVSPLKQLKRKKQASGASPYKSKAMDSRSNSSTNLPRSPGSRLTPTFSNSALLNPELTRQARDVLAQLRANANKLQDLIGN
ncbi:hypothetical protein PINS_up008799 [Pythium insidiosum]|nr:hypothetical protein PINS_up008799 [Pythium insidiosum]